MRRTFLPLVLAVLAAPLAAGAQPLSESCANVCASGADCTTPCQKFASVWITCGEHWGNPANDLDSDGVPNSSDNCDCTQNANQVDCDGDGAGDACDAVDNSWTLIDVGFYPCHLDIDEHIYEEVMEIYKENTYQSGCTGATCVLKYLDLSFSCGFLQDVTEECCIEHASIFECNHIPWNHDYCGTPRCSF